MPEEKRPLKVFLCHAHADRDAVRTLYDRLTVDGVDAWLDKEKLLPGQDWELEIRKAVREADVVVVCLSKHFNQAGYRQKEVRIALEEAEMQPEGEIFIIPARLEECDTLESLRKWQWVNLFEDDGYDMLIRALRVYAEKKDTTLAIERGRSQRITVPKSEKDTKAYLLSLMGIFLPIFIPLMIVFSYLGFVAAEYSYDLSHDDVVPNFCFFSILFFGAGLSIWLTKKVIDKRK